MRDVTAQAALKAALRDIVGPAARERGFKGSAPTWRKVNADGDWAVVNVQSSSSSSASHLQCIVNLAVAPAPWLAWSGGTKAVNEYDGLFHDRLHPTGASGDVEQWWDVYDDASARAVAHDMVAQLTASGWPVLDRLLDRTAFLEQLASGELGFHRREHFGAFFATAEALLLMERGPSERLERALQTALEAATPEKAESAQAFDRWVRERVADTPSPPE